jgi:hypothetical protein
MKHYLHTSTNPEGQTVTILRREDGAQIPFDEANPDYRAYLAWVEEGNTAEPWQPESTIPTE